MQSWLQSEMFLSNSVDMMKNLLGSVRNINISETFENKQPYEMKETVFLFFFSFPSELLQVYTVNTFVK